MSKRKKDVRSAAPLAVAKKGSKMLPKTAIPVESPQVVWARIQLCILSHSPLPGVVREEYVRCGKPNCRCAQGQRHGPYHYRYWREYHRFRKEYLKPWEVAETKFRCAMYRMEKREMRHLRQLLYGGVESCRTLEEQLRGTLAAMNTIPTEFDDDGEEEDVY